MYFTKDVQILFTCPKDDAIAKSLSCCNRTNRDQRHEGREGAADTFAGFCWCLFAPQEAHRNLVQAARTGSLKPTIAADQKAHVFKFTDSSDAGLTSHARHKEREESRGGVIIIIQQRSQNAQGMPFMEMFHQRRRQV